MFRSFFMSSIKKIQRQSGMRYKAVLKGTDQVIKTKKFTKQQLAHTWLRAMETDQETISALGLPVLEQPLVISLMSIQTQRSPFENPIFRATNPSIVMKNPDIHQTQKYRHREDYSFLLND